jgi:hypothetical protein
MLLVLLESPWQVRFLGGDLWDIEFWVIFVIENSTKLQKARFGRRKLLGKEFSFGPTTRAALGDIDNLGMG